jgi:hypothetical protein
MASKFYTIKVGTAEPQLVLRGEVNKKTGQPQGRTETGYAVMGGVAIPNFSIIWAKPYEKDGKRTGKFDVLKWGTVGGQAIEIRYLKSCASLDKTYQTQVGLKSRDDDQEIFLETGINEFDNVLHPGLVEMLKLHTANGDSPCRDPENTFIVFQEYDEQQNVTMAMKADRILFDAMGTVMDAQDDPVKLRILCVIYGIPIERKDALAIADLMVRLKANPLKFNEDRNNYLKECQRILIKARDFQILDLAITGEVWIVDGGPILQDLPIKLVPDKKLEYMLDNLMDPEIFEGVQKIKKALEQKERALN